MLLPGNSEASRGPVTEIAAQPIYLDVTMEAGAEFEIPVPVGHNAIVYVFEGGGLFGGGDVREGDYVEAVRMLEFEDGDQLRVSTGAGSQVRFMLMAGAPFKEPIVPYGPFVMNTQEEIQQALADLRNGTFVQN